MEELGIVGIFIAGIVGLVFGVAGLTYNMSRTACDRTAMATGLSTKYVGDKWVGGCFIEVDGKWIESANYGMGFTQK